MLTEKPPLAYAEGARYSPGTPAVRDFENPRKPFRHSRYTWTHDDVAARRDPARHLPVPPGGRRGAAPDGPGDRRRGLLAGFGRRWTGDRARPLGVPADLARRAALRDGLRRRQRGPGLRAPDAGPAVDGGPGVGARRGPPGPDDAVRRARHGPAAARPARLGGVERGGAPAALPRTRRRGDRAAARALRLRRAPLAGRPRHPPSVAARPRGRALGLRAGRPGDLRRRRAGIDFSSRRSGC